MHDAVTYRQAGCVVNISLHADQPLPVTFEIPIGQQSIIVNWPSLEPDGCARFIRGLVRLDT